MVQGNYSSEGFEVTANNAVDFIAGTQAASAGMISANIRRLGRDLHADFSSVERTLRSQAQQVGQVNAQGYARLESAIAHDTATTQAGLTQAQASIAAQTDSVVAELDELQADASDLQTISAASLAVQAAGFAMTIRQVSQLRGDLQLLHADLEKRGQELVEIQHASQGHLESLVDYAARTLATQDKILATLVHSRTSEAQQLIRQGWGNLQNGFAEDAHARFLKSLDYDNTVYLPHAELARYYESKGDLRRAEEHHHRAIAFSDFEGLRMKPFALVQLAGFLDRQKRLDEAIPKLREAVDLAETMSKTDTASELATEIPSWRYYLAETLASRGDVTEAMKVLQGCVMAMPRYFVAAMGSPTLLKCQPALTKTLTDVDSRKRHEGVTILSEVGIAIEALAAVGGPAETVQSFRQRAAKLLESLLTVEHTGIPRVQMQTRTLWSELELVLVEALGGEEARLLAYGVEQAATLGEVPRKDPPADYQEGRIALTGLAIGISLVSMIALIVLGISLGGSNQNDGGPSLLAWFFVSLTVAVTSLWLWSELKQRQLISWHLLYVAACEAWLDKLHSQRRQFDAKRAASLAPLKSQRLVPMMSALDQKLQKLDAIDPFSDLASVEKELATALAEPDDDVTIPRSSSQNGEALPVDKDKAQTSSTPRP